MDTLDSFEQEQVHSQGGWRVAQPDSCGVGKQECFLPMRLGYDQEMGGRVKVDVEQLLVKYNNQAVSVTGTLLG